jgi:hypothetical protein
VSTVLSSDRQRAKHAAPTVRAAAEGVKFASGRAAEADARIRTGDPFITRTLSALRRFAAD